jgi:hypothetical protein
MGSLIRKRPSPAFVVAMIALFVSLSASAVGLSGKNKIDANDLKKNVVALKNMKNNSVKGAEVVESSLAAVPNSNALGGSSLAEVNPGDFGFAAACSDLAEGTLNPCATATITLDRTIDVYVNVTAQWNSDEADGTSVTAECDVRRVDNDATTTDVQFGSTSDDTSDTQERTFAMNAFFAAVPAGDRSFEFRCGNAGTGDDMDMSQARIFAIPAVDGG